MARKKSSEKEGLWRQILRRQAESGLSIRSFCAAEEISEPSFYAWRKRLRQRPRDVSPEAWQSRHGEESADNAPLFVPLKLVDAAATLEIVHPLGYRIQLTGDVNPVTLRQVIETLDERGAR